MQGTSRVGIAICLGGSAVPVNVCNKPLPSGNGKKTVALKKLVYLSNQVIIRNTQNWREKPGSKEYISKTHTQKHTHNKTKYDKLDMNETNLNIPAV